MTDPTRTPAMCCECGTVPMYDQQDAAGDLDSILRTYGKTKRSAAKTRAWWQRCYDCGARAESEALAELDRQAMAEWEALPTPELDAALAQFDSNVRHAGRQS